MSRKHHKNKKHRRKPSKGQFSLWDSAWFIGALLVIAYGTHGVVVNDLSLPARYSAENFHEHGLAAWLTFGALLCAAVGMLRNVDSFTKAPKPSEASRIFPKLLSVVGWSLFVAGIVVQIFFSNP